VTRFLPHLPRERFPAESLAAALYEAGGVRTVGLGALAFTEPDQGGGVPAPPPWEYLRMAIPRRMYTDNHIAYAGGTVMSLWAKSAEVQGLRALDIPEHLPHFSAAFEPA
jgi:tryptophanase